jgi:hypothetical protein
MKQVSTISFTYTDSFEDQMWICAKCAHTHPELNPTPTEFIFNAERDAFISRCDICEERIIELVMVD